MTYRPPLVSYEVFVADPPELPVRNPGEQGPSSVTRAEVVSADAAGVLFKASASDGGSLLIQLTAVGEGVLRVGLGEEPDARPRSARPLPLVTPGSFPLDVRTGDGRLRISAGSITAEISMDPWQVRFL